MPRILFGLSLLAASLCWTNCPAAGPEGAALAQSGPIDPENRPVSEVVVRGLRTVPETLVRNQVRLEAGQPYRGQTVAEDIVRLTHLGRFASVRARVEAVEGGSVRLIYELVEQPMLSDVQVVGNKSIDDRDLLDKALLRAGDPADPFLIEQGKRQILDAYREKGYFLTEVGVDEKLLSESGVLVYKVREGPFIRLRKIRLEGNRAFDRSELDSAIKSRTPIPVFRRGELNREKIDQDAANLRDYYRDRGYLDAQVARRIDLSPDQTEGVVTFVIEEGPRYHVGTITVEGHQVFGSGQVASSLTLKPGDVFSEREREKSVEAVRMLYGRLGYIETRVEIERLFREGEPRVDVRVRVEEGRSYLVGKVEVRGNEVTRDNVVLRQVRGLEPGRRIDRAGVERTRDRVAGSGLFSDAKLSILGEASDLERDVLIEVEEQNTGNISFGAGVSSDAGVIGAIELSQRNFDLSDTPESAREFFTGRAFRGGGQQFQISLNPGDELSSYSVSFREPYLFDSPYSGDARLATWDRERENYIESRTGGGLGVGKRFGDVWSAGLRFRADTIDISDVQTTAPVDIFLVRGESFLEVVSLTIGRSTTDSVIFPTRGTRTSFTVEHAGLLGDYDFSRASLEYRKYWAVDEDYLGQKSVLILRVDTGFLLGNAPTFERFYAGGHRSMRGFEYRGVGPRGIRNDTQTLGKDPVGGDFVFLMGLEYNFPIYDKIVRMVVFTDTGTVQDDVGLEQYRASVGFGLRVQLPILGRATPPIALDVALPILKERTDETRFFSFDIALPF